MPFFTKIILGREWKVPNKHKEIIYDLFASNEPELLDIESEMGD